MHLPYSAYWVSGIAHHVISHQVSIFLVSFSFFLDKDQNLLFKNIVIVLGCNVVYIAVYFAWSRKKEFTQMWAYLQNVKPLLEDTKIKLTFAGLEINFFVREPAGD